MNHDVSFKSFIRWLHEHTEHPYPNEEDKQRLALRTGLTMKQVSDWFINARRRLLHQGLFKSNQKFVRGTTTPASSTPNIRQQNQSQRDVADA